MKRAFFLAWIVVLLLVPGLARAAVLSHGPLDAVLRAHVKDGFVDYPGIAVDKAFRDYVQQLAAPADLPTRAERLAYYINAYNALAIQGILEGLSPRTFWGRQRYFKGKTWQLDGQAVSLDELEHKLIRPLGEPRIHFAIVCASRSCPRLRAEAFTAERLDAQLEDSARGFVNDPSRNRFDKEKKLAYLSEIFRWFEEDFVRHSGSVQKYLARYASDPEVAQDLAADRYTIRYIDYDWNLNGMPPKG